MQVTPEQRKAIDLFLANRTFGCFDPQGSGKTAVPINAIIEAEFFPSLITVPAHLVSQWRRELERWGVPRGEIATFSKLAKPEEKYAAATGAAAFNVVSYHTWLTYHDQLLDPRFRSYTFDESHRLRKAKGATWSQIYRLRTKTRSKHYNTPIWALTGTPLVKDAGDVFPFLSLCDPTRWRFNARRKFVIDNCVTFSDEYRLNVGKVRNPDAFYRMLGKYSIRRHWKDIPSLAKLERRDIDFAVEIDQRTLNRHRAIKAEWRDPETGEAIRSAGAMVHALRRLSVSAKVDACTELVLDSSGRWLILAWYRDTARQAYHALTKAFPGRRIGYIDGSVDERAREAAVRAYRDNDNGIIVGTLATLQEGLDGLQVGSQAAFIEQHTLDAMNAQAIARLIRTGQRQPVLAYWLYAPKTFDVRVRRLAKSRKANIDEALREFLEEEEWSKK